MDKLNKLRDWFRQHENVAVAFSGGVDSSFLLAIGKDILGEKIIALTVKTPYIPDWEVSLSNSFCIKYGIKQRVLTAGIIPELNSNPVNRCYLCKHHIFSLLNQEALNLGFTCLIDGTNSDDTGIYRPGLKALQELGIKSPLMEIGITKQEVRYFSSSLGLETADMPSHACLLTRLPYNYEIRYDELIRIEKAELYLTSLGFGGSRVRNHGNIARIEVDKKRILEFLVLDEKGKIASYFHSIGYEFITIDLEGYRSGSFDKKLNQSEK